MTMCQESRRYRLGVISDWRYFRLALFSDWRYFPTGVIFRLALFSAVSIFLFLPAALAQQPSTTGRKVDLASALNALYKTNYLGFLKQIESPEMTNNVIASDALGDLRFKEINALFFYRRFDELLPKIDQFLKNYPASTNSPAISEYLMATLFERGLKNAQDAAKAKDQEHINRRWNQARTNLTQFLALAASFDGTNYNFLPKRSFKDDVWRAQMMLGNGAGASVNDPVAQERFDFLRIKLFDRLYKDQVDQNLALQTNWRGSFPESDDKAYVRLLAAEYGFRKGRLLTLDADALQKSGDTNAASAERVLVGQYFGQMRALQGQIVTNEAAGILDSDVLDSYEDLLYSYWLEKNYNTLLSLASTTIANSPPGSLDWIVATTYTGIALASLPTPNYDGAVSALDEVLAQGFKNNAHNDHFIAFAARWRIALAKQAGDTNKVSQLVFWVKDSNCDKKVKAEFLSIDGWRVGLSKN